MLFWLWIFVLVGAVILEVITATSLISIWFAVGSIFGLIANQLGLNFVWQVVIFLITSILSIVIVRPYVYKYVKQNTVATNADRLIGVQTKLLKDISLDTLGEVKVNGVVWNATSINHQKINADSIVEIKAIDGTKLIVVKID